MKQWSRWLTILTVCVAFSFGSEARAALKIEINKGNVDPLPIAITNFAVNGPESYIAENIANVVKADLERSGLFKAIDPAAFIERDVNNQAVPTFDSWRKLNASGLVTGTITNAGGGNIKVDFRLWDVFVGQQAEGKSFTAPEASWRRIAHKISDAIYQRLTGEEGYFDTRIVYVAEGGTGKHRIKRLAIMDQDGANQKFLTGGENLVLTPRFSPNSQEVIYLSYVGKKGRVFLRNIETGRERVIGDFQGLSYAPRFSNDGSKIIMTVADNGNSDIYVMDLRSHAMRRITNDPSIDTSASFSPDGNQIVFNSDRGGSQQLYVMNSDGSNVRRISFGDGKYGSPVWSPRGDLIVFTKMHGGTFYTGVMRPDGSGERLISQSFLDESPTWSPNGRVVIFTRQGQSSRTAYGKSRLMTVDLTGYNLREVTTPTDASDPAWSPLL